MKLSNLHTIILAIIVVYAGTLVAIKLSPDAAASIKELASLVLGGFLAIMRPPSQVSA
jgi:hypothetical protein